MIDPKVFKQVRKALGLSQQELADALGLSRVTVNKMERGRLRRGIPDEVADRLLAIKAQPEKFITGPHVTKGKSTYVVWEKKGAIPQTVSTHPTREDAEQNVKPDSFLTRWESVIKSDAHLWDNEEDES